MAKYVEQIKQLENQFKQQVKQYESMTSARGLANVINSQYDTDALSGINTDSILRDSGINSASDFKLPEDRGRTLRHGSKKRRHLCWPSFPLA
ncbi:Type IV secretion system proteins [Citrobacter koseri]|uniref:Type IV secretion system proteins n=1 Tax=Citrobacter koseri TaxID=545 RepID=A0A2X2WKI1_CITKO|nr:Type IV secretion system proteins [Citrobacter koseri]